MHPAAKALTSLGLSLALAGCGYQLSGKELRTPGGVRSIHIGTFENRSREFGLDKLMELALERELHRRARIRLVHDADGADAVLRGTIQGFSTRPLSFDAQDRALQYEALLVVDLVLVDPAESVLWRADGIREAREYTVASRIMVPSTTQFQQGTIAVEDLPRLTDIQLAETEKRLASERLLEDVAADVFNRLLDDF